MTDSALREIADHFIGVLKGAGVTTLRKGKEFAEGYSAGFQVAREGFKDGGAVPKSKDEQVDEFLDALFEISADTPKLGDRVVHGVSGFKGTVISVCEYLHSCPDVQVQPTIGKDGAFQDAKWFPISSVEKV